MGLTLRGVEALLAWVRLLSQVADAMIEALKHTTVDGHIETRLSQAQLLHKEFAQPLNVIIIAKTNLRSQARAHVILFSSDLALPYAQLVDYYSLRFQIEIV
jgi:hypothetical protein